MGSVRLAAHEVQPLVDLHAGMTAITAAYEDLRHTLRCRDDWSEGQVICELKALAHTALVLATGLRRRRDRTDQNHRPRRAARDLSVNFLAGPWG